MTAEVDYNDGFKELYIKEVNGRWLKQGRYVDMSIDEQHSIDQHTFSVMRVNHYFFVA